jgi:hypothetical protein
MSDDVEESALATRLPNLSGDGMTFFCTRNK